MGSSTNPSCCCRWHQHSLVVPLSNCRPLLPVCVSWSTQLTAVVLRTRGNVGIYLDGCMGVCFIVCFWFPGDFYKRTKKKKKQISFKEISLPLNILGCNPHSPFISLNFSLAPFLPVHIYYFCELQPHEDSKRLNYLPKFAVRKRKLRLFHLNLSGSGILCSPPPPPAFSQVWVRTKSDHLLVFF